MTVLYIIIMLVCLIITVFNFKEQKMNLFGGITPLIWGGLLIFIIYKGYL